MKKNVIDLISESLKTVYCHLLEWLDFSRSSQTDYNYITDHTGTVIFRCGYAVPTVPIRFYR